MRLKDMVRGDRFVTRLTKRAGEIVSSESTFGSVLVRWDDGKPSTYVHEDCMVDRVKA